MLFWCFSFERLTHGCRGPAWLTGFPIKETELPQCLRWVWISRARCARAAAAPAAARTSRCGPVGSSSRMVDGKIYSFLLFYGKQATSIDDHWKNLLWMCRRCTCTPSARNAASLLVSCSLITTALMAASRQLPNRREHVLPILNN